LGVRLADLQTEVNIVIRPGGQAVFAGKLLRTRLLPSRCDVKECPGHVESIFTSLSTVAPSHPMDPNLFGFKD
jgi:hypothetical protein